MMKATLRTLTPLLLFMSYQYCCGIVQGPPATWERETADTHTASRTWGLKDNVLRQLIEDPSPAMLEVNSRLAQMYPDFEIAHMPAEHMQHTGLDGLGNSVSQPGSTIHGALPAEDNADVVTASGCIWSGAGSGSQVNASASCGAAPTAGLDAAAGPQQFSEQAQHDASGSPGSQAAYCAAFVGNAPVHGDTYCYHVDADPSGLPPSRSAHPPPHACIPRSGRRPLQATDRDLLRSVIYESVITYGRTTYRVGRCNPRGSPGRK